VTKHLKKWDTLNTLYLNIENKTYDRIYNTRRRRRRRKRRRRRRRRN